MGGAEFLEYFAGCPFSFFIGDAANVCINQFIMYVLVVGTAVRHLRPGLCLQALTSPIPQSVFTQDGASYLACLFFFVICHSTMEDAFIGFFLLFYFHLLLMKMHLM